MEESDTTDSAEPTLLGFWEAGGGEEEKEKEEEVGGGLEEVEGGLEMGCKTIGGMPAAALSPAIWNRSAPTQPHGPVSC